ncbi:MAG: chemotaxis protein CheD [Phycisphaerae bacterium]
MSEQTSQTHRIGIAEMAVAKPPDSIRTVLGSCVGVVLFDPTAKVGGMCHVILPSSDGGKGEPGKFADTAVDKLLNDVMKAGCNQRRITAKIAGGASMFGGNVDSGLGDRNVVAVKGRLDHHAIRLTGEDVGGTKGRRMVLNPETGEVEVQIIGQQARVL